MGNGLRFGYSGKLADRITRVGLKHEVAFASWDLPIDGLEFDCKYHVARDLRLCTLRRKGKPADGDSNIENRSVCE